MRKAKHRLRRGYKFASFAGAPAPTCRQQKYDGPLSVPLASGLDDGASASPCVKAGDAIRKGQEIATFEDVIGAPIHAPVTGSVESVKSLAIVLTPTDTSAEEKDGQTIRIDGAIKEWETLSPEALRTLIYLSGAANLAGDGMPTEHGSAKIAHEEVERIIVSCISDDILEPSPEALFEGDRIGWCIVGLKILAAAYPGSNLTVAVSTAYRAIAERIENEIASADIEVVFVGDRFPQSHEAILVPAVSGEKFPDGVAAIHTGCLVLDCQTPIHVYQAVVEGLPVTHRRIAVAGSQIEEPGHVDVAIGTPIAEIVGEKVATDETRIVMNSLMLGHTASDDEVVTPQTRGVYCIPEARGIQFMSFASPGFTKDSYTNTFAAKFLPFKSLPIKKTADTNLHGEQRACLNCSYCAEVCPVEIMPNLLHRYVERDMISESLPIFGMLKCIDCNLCTYVCPSKIPLAALMKEGKRRLFEEGYVTEADMNKDFALKGLDQ